MSCSLPMPGKLVIIRNDKTTFEAELSDIFFLQELRGGDLSIVLPIHI